MNPIKFFFPTLHAFIWGLLQYIPHKFRLELISHSKKPLEWNCLRSKASSVNKQRLKPRVFPSIESEMIIHQSYIPAPFCSLCCSFSTFTACAIRRTLNVGGEALCRVEQNFPCEKLERHRVGWSVIALTRSSEEIQNGVEKIFRIKYDYVSQ